MTEQVYTLRQQADELRLIGSERRHRADALRGKREAEANLMDVRLPVLRACYDTINKLAIAEEAAAAKASDLDTKQSIPEPELDEWGDPI